MLVLRRPSWSDTKQGLKYFAWSAGFLVVTLIVQPGDSSGYLHWLPETFGFFFAGAALRILVPKFWAAAIPIALIVSTNLVLWTQGYGNAFLVLFEALAVFGAAYFLGYRLEAREESLKARDRADSRDEDDQGNDVGSQEARFPAA